MPRGKIPARHFLEVNRLALTAGARGTKKTSLIGERQWGGGILRDNLGEGKRESQIAMGQWGVNVCRKAFICLAGPSGMLIL